MRATLVLAVVLFLSIGSACGSGDGTPAPAGSTSAITATGPSAGLAQADPASVLRRLIDTINRGDANAAVALFKADATWERGGRCPAGQCTGTPDVRIEVETDVRNSHRLDLASLDVAGPTATARVELQTMGTRMAGVPRIIQLFTITVTDGAISSLKVANDLNDPTTVAFMNRRGG